MGNTSKLVEYKQMYIEIASGLEGYDKMSKTELANGYCDADEAGDTTKKNQYFAALMLRYWNKIYEWKNNSASLYLQTEEFIPWLEDSLMIAFRYRSWRNPNDKLYNDPNGPDKVINRCCFSTRGREYQYVNKDKRKGNMVVYSVEGFMDNAGDAGLAALGCTSDEIFTDGTKELVKRYLEKGKTLEAIIIDSIARGDSFKTVKGFTTLKVEDKDGELKDKRFKVEKEKFDTRRLVKFITELDEEYLKKYFCRMYGLEGKEKEIKDLLADTKNNKIYRCIKKTFIEILNNPDLMSYLA